MADRPIIFSAPMVQALLAGSKTQTRRLVKPQPISQGRKSFGEAWSWNWPGTGFAGVTAEQIVRFGIVSGMTSYTPGDRLYAREAHALVPRTAYLRSDGVQQTSNPSDCDMAAIYRAGWERSTGGIQWRPSIHMPRWASRLTLTVTEVRVQRLQEISEADARAEGCEGHPDRRGEHGTARGAFRLLWAELHGEDHPGAWDTNPWVVAISFTVARGNIDADPR